MALNSWVARRHQACSSELLVQLETRCGLQSTLDDLEYIYFANGAMNTKVNNMLFEKMDRVNRRWNDGSNIAASFQGAFHSIPSDRIRIYVGRKEQQEIKGARCSMSALEDIRVFYTIPWPVANVIRTESIGVYHRVFIFLTQLYRAKYMLLLQKSPKSVQATDQRQLCKLYTLPHRLLWLQNTMLTCVYDIVLSVATADMRVAMNRAEDVNIVVASTKLTLQQPRIHAFWRRNTRLFAKLSYHCSI